MYAMYYVAVGSLAALAFAACMFFRVKKEPGGSKEMLGISGAVQKGANAYLKRQYKGVGIFFAAVFVILMGMAICGFLSFFTPFIINPSCFSFISAPSLFNSLETALNLSHSFILSLSALIISVVPSLKEATSAITGIISGH